MIKARCRLEQSSSRWRIPLYEPGSSMEGFVVETATDPQSLAWTRRPATRLTAHLTASNRVVRSLRTGDHRRKRSPRGCLFRRTMRIGLSIWWARAGSNPFRAGRLAGAGFRSTVCGLTHRILLLRTLRSIRADSLRDNG
jgi:hypothetical protein